MDGTNLDIMNRVSDDKVQIALDVVNLARYRQHYFGHVVRKDVNKR